MGVIRVNNNRIHRNIREITSLVRPCEGAAVGSAGYLENVTRRCRRISVEPAYGCITHGQIRGRHGGIERDAKHGAQRHNAVIASDIDPVCLCLSAGAEVEADPDVGIVGANHRHGLIFR